MSLRARPAPLQSSLQAELAEVLGVADAETLCSAFAGRTIYVPSPDRLGDNHPLVAAIGAPAAKLVAYYYECTKLEFPVGVVRRQRVLALKAAGMQNSAIAAQLLCTDRYVRKVLAAARETDNSQPSLFD